MFAQQSLHRAPNVIQVDSWAEALQTLSTRILVAGHEFRIKPNRNTAMVAHWFDRLDRRFGTQSPPEPEDPTDYYVVADKAYTIEVPLTDVTLWVAVGPAGLPTGIDAPAQYVQPRQLTSFDTLRLAGSYWSGADGELATGALAILREAQTDTANGLGPLLAHFLSFDNQYSMLVDFEDVDLDSWANRAAECPVCYSITCDVMACGTCHKPVCMTCHRTLQSQSNSAHYRCPSCNVADATKPRYALGDGLDHGRGPGHLEQQVPLEHREPLAALLAILLELLQVTNNAAHVDEWGLAAIAIPLAEDATLNPTLLTMIGLDILHRQDLIKSASESWLTEHLRLLTIG